MQVARVDTSGHATGLLLRGQARPAPRALAGPVRADGKFFSVGAERFAFRGVTYGTFRPRHDSARYPEPAVVRADLRAMARAGFTVVRTYTEPTADLLDAAGEVGMRVLAGIFEPDWRYLLGTSRRQRREVSRAMVAGAGRVARRMAGDPRVLALCLGNEIPADVIRWYGEKAVADAVAAQVEAVREVDGGRLVTYGNYPTAEYLDLPELDFLTFNVFLDDAEDLRRYVSRLHQLAGDRPLVLGELGADAGGAHGPRRQAELVDAQLEICLERGVAGTCLFSWTDEWWVGETPVEGWHFGLTTAERAPRPALDAAARWNRRSVADLRSSWPSVSVVVCAYNAAETLDECLAHTCALDYPDLEVLVVDDGSTDATPDIAASHPRARLLRIDHGGLAVARNHGYRNATGQVVAYLDADAYPSPEWPYYLVLGFDHREVGAVGGPNLAPPEDGTGAQVVAQSPGGPVHVLLSDDRAEHVPGCNMAFWAAVLDEVGGFDPIYTRAGDDVDICWKVLDRRWAIGFHPAALVWHHRRPGLRRYLRQQSGYGHAEALVEARHPDRFSPVGTARWRGRIYDSLVPDVRRARIYRGLFGTAPYQGLYRSDAYGLDLAHQVGMPMAAVGLATAPLGLVAPVLGLPAAASAAFVLVLAVIGFARARAPRHLAEGRWAFRARVVAHHLLQPLVRAWARRRGAPEAWRGLAPTEPLPGPVRHLAGGVVVLPEDRPRQELVATVVGLLRRRGLRAQVPSGWEDHDGSFRLGPLARAELQSSSHPIGFVQLRMRPRIRWASSAAVAASAAGALVAGQAAMAALIVLFGALALARAWWLARVGLAIVISAAASPAESQGGGAAPTSTSPTSPGARRPS